MQQKLNTLEINRTMMVKPKALELEDETVDDDPEQPLRDDDDEEDLPAPDPMEEDADPAELMPPPPPRPATVAPPPVVVVPDAEEEEESESEEDAMPPPSTDNTQPPVVAVSVPAYAESTVPLAASEPPPPPAPPVAPEAADIMERQTLLRQLDLLRLKFKQSIIPPDIETQATPTVRLVVERNLTNLRRCRNLAMYKLGLAAFLVVLEFLLARLTRLDMSRFLAWHCANLSAYEELLAEFSAIETPFSTAPAYVQLMVLITFNTAIFIGSALIQKAFQVDILPIVCSMTGANPIEAPAAAKPAAAKPAATPPRPKPPSSPFAAFSKNFFREEEK